MARFPASPQRSMPPSPYAQRQQEAARMAHLLATWPSTPTSCGGGASQQQGDEAVNEAEGYYVVRI